MTKNNYRGTEVQEFLRCHARYNYGYIQNLEPKHRNEKLTTGSAIHKFLELFYSGHGVAKSLEALIQYIDENNISDDEVAHQDLKELAENICINYVSHYKNDLRDYKIIAVEMPFNIPLNPDTNYTGIIDLIVEDRDGKVWFMDHKTTNSIDIFDKNSDMDRQISRYWAALEVMGYNIQGFIYNILLKDYPQPPKVLKSGALSKDKSQKTDYTLYQQAIVDNGLNPDDYTDFLQYLQDQPKEFFRRITVERTAQERKASLDELEQVIEDIQIKSELLKPKWYRNITKDCHWDCPFRSLCVAEMDGSNADHIRNELFKVKDVE